MVLKIANLNDGLVANSTEEYYDPVVAINDTALRAGIIAGITREKVKARFYDSDECDRASDPFADMFWRAYQNHTAIQSSDRRDFHYKDVLKKSAP